MLFQKQDLGGDHYEWSEETRNIYNGQPSRRLFDKVNGDQVLFIINFFGAISQRLTLQEGRTIEKKIQFDLPESVRSEVAVFNWIRSIY